MPSPATVVEPEGPSIDYYDSHPCEVGDVGEETFTQTLSTKSGNSRTLNLVEDVFGLRP